MKSLLRRLTGFIVTILTMLSLSGFLQAEESKSAFLVDSEYSDFEIEGMITHPWDIFDGSKQRGFSKKISGTFQLKKASSIPNNNLDKLLLLSDMHLNFDIADIEKPSLISCNTKRLTQKIELFQMNPVEIKKGKKYNINANAIFDDDMKFPIEIGILFAAGQVNENEADFEVFQIFFALYQIESKIDPAICWNKLGYPFKHLQFKAIIQSVNK